MKPLNSDHLQIEEDILYSEFSALNTNKYYCALKQVFAKYSCLLFGSVCQGDFNAYYLN